MVTLEFDPPLLFISFILKWFMDLVWFISCSGKVVQFSKFGFNFMDLGSAYDPFKNPFVISIKLFKIFIDILS